MADIGPTELSFSINMMEELEAVNTANEPQHGTAQRRQQTPEEAVISLLDFSINMMEGLETVNTGNEPQHGTAQRRLQTQEEAVISLLDSIFDDDRFSAVLLELTENHNSNLQEILDQLTEAAPEPSEQHPVGECQIHLEEVPLSPPRCCQYPVCNECMVTYVQTAVSERRLQIPCINPNCASFLSREDIRQKLDEHHKLKFDQFLVDENKDPHKKTCPRCNKITSDESFTSTADQKALERAKTYGLKITCSCQHEWCFNCQTPYHEGITCSQYRKGNKLFSTVSSWAKKHRFGQVNARKCPTCLIYIERNGGCNHMDCKQCNTKFCYVCGTIQVYRLDLPGDRGRRFRTMGCCGYSVPISESSGEDKRGRLKRGVKIVGEVVGYTVIITLLVGALAAATPIALVLLPAYGVYKISAYVFYKISEKLFQINRNREQNCSAVQISRNGQQNPSAVQINRHRQKNRSAVQINRHRETSIVSDDDYLALDDIDYAAFELAAPVEGRRD